MDAISSVQLVLLGIVVVALMLELIAMKQGMLVRVEYSKGARFALALFVVITFAFFAIISPGPAQPLFALWGLPIAIIIYRKKDWHKVKPGLWG
ncbi:hypothetical protein [Alteromonas sp. AMM-1]|uniref:hypothetical protein n=1 Tax=Alteromonas sp. AMM-1 TaxID=3394233 RepID=UPI0039A6C56A